jgi:hypothetical protein
MSQYLVATRFAAQGFLSIAADGRAQIATGDQYEAEQRAELQAHAAVWEAAADLDAIVAAGALKHVAEHNAEQATRWAGTLRALLLESVQLACGALLQLGKKGIATAHGKRTAAPPGRMLGSQPLRDVVWGARNQAMHAEEGAYREETLSVFRRLSADFGSKFYLDSTVRQSRASEVCELLGWTEYAAFEKDMRDLLGPDP